jgi:integrase
MASIKKGGSGWRAQVATLGVRESKVFSTKAEATAWATLREAEIRSGKNTGVQAGRTLGEAFRRYEKEVSAHKEGHRWEALRLNAIGRFQLGGVQLADMKLADVTSDVLGQWRDYRLNVDGAKGPHKGVVGSTINRELNLISHVFTCATKEWKWIVERPTTNVRRPKESEHRERLYTEDEIERLCFALGFDLGGEEEVKTVSQRVAATFLFALETAMRAGEICNLVSQDIIGRAARVRKSKTTAGKRNVPLSPRALELLKLLPVVPDDVPMFGVSSASVDALFRKARDRAMIENSTFHDSRHNATTRLAKKLQVLDLARAIGHADLKKLMVYYNESAEEMAKLLN